MANNEMWTVSGLLVDPFNLKPADVRLDDIAHHLAMMCRFGGAVDPFYSVAQHSVLTSENCDESDAFDGLLHDGAEYLLGDHIKPLKSATLYKFGGGLREVGDVERRILHTIGEALGRRVNPDLNSVKAADDRMFATEVRDLVVTATMEGVERPMPEPYDFKIEPVGPDEAKRMFLSRYEALARI